MTVRAFNHWDSATVWRTLGFFPEPGKEPLYSVELSTIAGGTVSASSVYSTSVASFARDGNAGTQWHSMNTSVNPWIMIDFTTAQTVSRMTIQQRAEAVHKFKDVLVEYSTDNSVWIPVYRLKVAAPVSLAVHTVEFAPVSARYWRLRMTALNESSDWYFVVQEWGIFGGTPVSRFHRRGDRACALVMPKMPWIGAAHGSRVYWRGEYRTNTNNDLQGYFRTDSLDVHKTVPDEQWHKFQVCTLVDGDWAWLWAFDNAVPALGWIEFRNVVLDTEPMPMGWDGNTWNLITETWDGNKWRGDAEAWNGTRWLKMYEDRVDPGGEQWSPWYEVQPSGTPVPTGALVSSKRPIAVFETGWANYGDGNWATVKWRYSSSGRVECYGLVWARQIFTPVQTVIFRAWLPDSCGANPKITGSLAMLNCMSSHLPVPGTQVSQLRVDVTTAASQNPSFSLVMTPNGSTSNIETGTWVGLNMCTDLTQGDY